MDIGEYVEFFDPDVVGAWLRWDAVTASNCPVTQICTRSREYLAGLYTMWYVTPDGSDGDWRGERDRPLRVGEAHTTSSSWPEGRADRIARLRDAFQREGRPVHLVLPGYSLGNGRVLLLDGTHRAVAAHLSGLDVRLMVFSIEGPMDAAVLPDLARYSASAAASACGADA
ncbi:hypothetical protein ABZT47_19600 [Sphaerisporangium sp. NPDC005289]|uniref:hypothetical protein n=1 Tax=Sphaerisporangium sp. NPDC005289 TaxID=3155247 RepID=UPI0033AC6AD7